MSCIQYSMDKIKLQFFILTGEPGVGKTTLIKKVTSVLKEKNITTVGFYTEEVRKNRSRDGFDVVTLEGDRGRLARDMNFLNTQVKYKVGKYGVLIEEFEKVAIPCFETLQMGKQSQLLVVDEIGKMEFFSTMFKEKIKEIVNSSTPMLATIPIRKGDPLIEKIRNSNKAKIWVVTHENRDMALADIVNVIETTIKS